MMICYSLLLTLTAAWAQPSGNWTDNYAQAYESEEVNNYTYTIHIENGAQLARLAYELNNPTKFSEKTVRVHLDADIDLSAHFWTPINNTSNNSASAVILYGNSYKITGMKISQSSTAGLFGDVKNLEVRNLTISNAQIDAIPSYAGFIAAKALNSTFNSCTVEGSSLTISNIDGNVNSYGGGLVGRLEIANTSTTLRRNKVVYTTLTEQEGRGAIGGLFGAVICTRKLDVVDCHANVEMTCNPRPQGNSAVAGGLVGDIESPDNGEGAELAFSYCTSSGSLTGYDNSGGLVGNNACKLAIVNCVSSLSIECRYSGLVMSIGGLLGNAAANSSTDIRNSFSSSYLYCHTETSVGGLVGSVRDNRCNLTLSTYAGTIFGDTQSGGAVVGYIPSNVSQMIKDEHRFNDVIYDRSLCNLPAIGNADGFTEDEITSKKSKELTSDEAPYNSLLMAPIDVRTAYENANSSTLNPKMCYEDNIMLAAIPFYVKDPLHAYFCAWQVTTVSELIPVAYNRSTKRALGAFDLRKAPNGAEYSHFLSVKTDDDSQVKTVTPLDPGEVDVVVTYFNAETNKSLQRKVHLVVTYGIPWNNNEPADFPGGNGAINDPYLIQNATQLLRVANDKELYNRSDMYYRLTNDIFLNTNLLQTDETAKDGARAWTPVEWRAHLDGNGNSIYGVYITNYIQNARVQKVYTGSAEPKTYYKKYDTAGLFSILSGHVHDLGIVDSYLSVNTQNTENVRSGLLCGVMTGDAKVERCIFHGIVDNYNYPGGVVGHAGDIDAYASASNNRSLDNPVVVDCGIIEDCFACVHVEYDLHHTSSSSSPGTGSGIAGSGVKQINRCVFTGKVENFDSRRGIAPNIGSASDVNTWYFDKQQMTTEFQTTPGTGEHTTAEMIGGDIFAGSSVWQHEKGRYPMLRQFANTTYGDILSMPVLFADGDRAGRVTKVFEFPTNNVTWNAVHGDTYVDVINECGGASPMSTGADYIYVRTDESNSQCTRALRVMHLNVVVPNGTTVGIDFKDVNCKKAWLAALGKNVDTGVVTLRDAVTVTEDQAKAFNTTASANNVTAFPEMRFFTGIKVLKPDMLSNLSALSELELPRQLTDIGPEVFSGCSSLESVTIPSTTTTIEGGVLDGSSIRDIYVEPRNTSFEVRDHALFTTNEDLRLMAYPPARGEESITLHGPFHNIAYHAFYKIPGLEKIYIDYPKPDGSVVQLEDEYEAIVHYNYETNDQLMDIYVNDGTFDGSQWTAEQYATGGNDDGILMKEFLAKSYWQPYAEAGKLHRYFPLTVTSAKWATMYIGFCTRLPDNMKAYVLPTSPNNSDTQAPLTLKRTSNRLHHTVPVAIYCEEPGTYILSPEPGMSPNDDVPMTGNYLQGTDIGQNGNYGYYTNQTEIQNEFSVLALSLNKNGQVGFYGFVGTWIPPYKAYLLYNQVQASPLKVLIDDEILDVTGIDKPLRYSARQPSESIIYNLYGRRIETPTRKGLYIVNGQKVVVR